MSEREYKESRSNIWPAGTYPCEIIKCDEKVSKSGNKMFECVVKLYNDQGHTTNVFSYLIAEGRAAWQLRSAAESFGLLDKYNAGDLDDLDFHGRSAYAVVGIQKATDEYPEKNVIKSFKAAAPAIKSPTKADIDELEKDPFLELENASQI